MRIERGITALLLALAALAALATAGLSVADTLLRYLLASPLLSQGWMSFLIQATVLLGAAGALYGFRDNTAPRGPSWLGPFGGFAAAILCALAVAAILAGTALKMIYDVREDLQRLDSGPPIWITDIVALAGLAAVALAAFRAAAGALRREPALPLAALALAAALGLGVAALGLDLRVLTVAAQSLVDFDFYVLWPLIAVGAVAGGVAALKPGSRIALVALPATAAVLTAAAGEASVSSTLWSLVPAFLVAALLSVPAGFAGGFGRVVDLVIGVAIAFVLAFLPSTGLVTPSEAASLIGLPVALLLALIALIVKGRPAWRGLARGFAFGIGALFAALSILLCWRFLAQLGWSAAVTEKLEPIFASAIGGPIVALALAAALAALVGVRAGAVIVALLASGSGKGAADPVVLFAVLVLGVMAGGIVHGWLAPRLLGAKAGPALGLTAALTMALACAAAALLIVFVPDLVLHLE